MTRLLLVDGTNIVMRSAFGGEIEPMRAVQGAVAMIARAVRRTQATHLIVAFDHPAPTWRKQLDATYKATREKRSPGTAEYVAAATTDFEREGWLCLQSPGFEADDILATLAARCRGNNVGALILSSDGDVLQAIGGGVEIMRPQQGGEFARWGHAAVVAKYGVGPTQLADYKAIVGERSDNIAGVPGLGPKKAQRLLAVHQDLDSLLKCEIPDASRDAALVRAHRDQVLHARRLATLVEDVPMPAELGPRARLARSSSAA